MLNPDLYERFLRRCTRLNPLALLADCNQLLDDFERKPDLAPFETFLAQAEFRQGMRSQPGGIDG